MTVVVGFAMPSCGILVADSRLTRGPEKRDVCQKIFPLSDDALVGFSGGARSAVALIKGLFQTGAVKDLTWLLDSNSAEATIQPLFSKLRGPQVSLIFAFRWLQGVVGSALVIPKLRLVRVDCDPFRHTMVDSDFAVLGSGSYIGPRIAGKRAPAAIRDFARWEDERGWALQALFAATVVVQRLVRERPESTIGGLYQVCCLTLEGVRAVPYLTGDEAHPVFMNLERGLWVQEDSHSGTRVVVRNPLQDDSFLRTWSGPETFDVPAPATAPTSRVEWVASLRPDDDAVYGYEESTGAFTRRIPLPPPPRQPSPLAKLVQPLVQADWLAQWMDRRR
jgi:hypothetical protein